MHSHVLMFHDTNSWSLLEHNMRTPSKKHDEESVTSSKREEHSPVMKKAGTALQLVNAEVFLSHGGRKTVPAAKPLIDADCDAVVTGYSIWRTMSKKHAVPRAGSR